MSVKGNKKDRAFEGVATAIIIDFIRVGCIPRDDNNREDKQSMRFDETVGFAITNFKDTLRDSFSKLWKGPFPRVSLTIILKLIILIPD